MSLLEELERAAKAIRATIVYPEPQDERIVLAAGAAAQRGIARPVLVGPASAIPRHLPPGVEVELTDDSPRLKELVSSYAAQRSVARIAVIAALVAPFSARIDTRAHRGAPIARAIAPRGHRVAEKRVESKRESVHGARYTLQAGAEQLKWLLSHTKERSSGACGDCRKLQAAC